MSVANGFANGRVGVVQEQRGDRACGFAVHPRHGVLVDTGGERLGVVTQPSADDLQMDAGFERGCRVAVPHVMQPDVRQSAPLGEPIEPLADHVRVNGAAILPGEHPIGAGVVAVEEGAFGLLT